MNWAFSVKNKIKSAIILLILCVVILLSNFRTQDLIEDVSTKIETIYKDRLVVQHLIFSYNQVIEKLTFIKEERLAGSTLLKENSLRISDLERQFLNTKLTNEEAQLFDSFSKKIENLKDYSMDDLSWEDLKLEVINDLNRLEAIQMEEASREMTSIKNISESQILNFKLETTVLIILLLIVQVLILNASSTTKGIAKNNIIFN